jgi:hypothetical protein
MLALSDPSRKGWIFPFLPGRQCNSAISGAGTPSSTVQVGGGARLSDDLPLLQSRNPPAQGHALMRGAV